LRVEYIPVLLGLALALLGAAIMWDGWGPQSLGPMRDRRRRSRAPIDSRGELVAGFGIVLLGVALVGRDWRFETVTVLVGTACVLLGALRNQKYFREVLLFRGAARRNSPESDKKPGKMRIR
jgi:hypothetical protein